MSYSSILTASPSTDATSITSSTVDDIPSLLFDGQIKVRIVKAKRTPSPKSPVSEACVCPVVTETKVTAMADHESPRSSANVTQPSPKTAQGNATGPLPRDNDWIIGTGKIGKREYRYKKFAEPGEPVVTGAWSDYVIAPFGVIGGPPVELTCGVFMFGMMNKFLYRCKQQRWETEDEREKREWEQEVEMEVVAQSSFGHLSWVDRAFLPYQPWLDLWERFDPRALEATAY